ncbi:hypothetical protein V866_005724 [Kwoniella sp. B9012]
MSASPLAASSAVPPVTDKNLVATHEHRRLSGSIVEKVFDEHVETLEDEKTEDVVHRDQFGTTRDISPEERRLVRKLDWHIMPILFAMYFLNKTDQNSIANARLGSLEKDLHLRGNQFNVCVSVLYAGYTLVQIPSNLLMSTGRVSPSIWMTCWMMAWAVVSGATAAVQSYGSLFAVRFLLGFTEAPFYPGALYLLSIFYTRREIASRVAILYSAVIFSSSVGGLITAAVFSTLDGKHGIVGWRWLFLILGVVTFGIAFLGFWLLPNQPLNTRWLTPEERKLAQARMDRDTVGLQESKGAIAGLKQAAIDLRLWVFCLLQISHLAATGFNSFFPTVIKTLGYSTTITLVLTCPVYLFAGIFSVSLGYSSGRFNERTWHITGSMLIALIGFVMAAVTLNKAVRFVSLFLFAAGSYSANSVITGWVSATCGQTPEKKAAALGIMNSLSMTSFIWTPYLYPKSNGPQYNIAMWSNAAFVIVVLVCAWVMRIWLQQTNKRIRRDNPDAALLYAY